MKRIVDPSTSMITELACGQDPGKPAFQSPIYMKISGDRIVLSGPPGISSLVSGTGTAHGKPWQWNYLEFSINYASAQGDAQIKDVNFLVSNMIVARKQIFTASGIPVELYDIEMTKLDERAYQALFESMGCASATIQ